MKEGVREDISTFCEFILRCLREEYQLAFCRFYDTIGLDWWKQYGKSLESVLDEQAVSLDK